MDFLYWLKKMCLLQNFRISQIICQWTLQNQFRLFSFYKLTSTPDYDKITVKPIYKCEMIQFLILAQILLYFINYGNILYIFYTFLIHQEKQFLKQIMNKIKPESSPGKYKIRYKTEFDDHSPLVDIKNMKQEQKIKINKCQMALPAMKCFSPRQPVLEETKYHSKNYSNLQNNETHINNKKGIFQNSMLFTKSRVSPFDKENFRLIKKYKNESKFQFDSTFLTQTQKQQCFSHRFKSREKKVKDVFKFPKGKYILDQSARLFGEMERQQLQSIYNDIQQIQKVYSQLVKFTDFCIFKGFQYRLKTNLGRLIFFFGRQLDQTAKRQQIGQLWLSKITKSLHHQIYCSLILQIPQIAMQCLIECARVYSNQRKFLQSEYFCQIALKIAIYYGNKFYQESALQQIGLCLYKMGNIQGATQLHDNLSKISSWSRKQFLRFYNQQSYIKTLKDFLYGNAKLDTTRHLRLIQTIVFDKNQNQQNQSSFITKAPQIKDRLLISKTNKNINQFKIIQQKINDIRKVSNQIAIKSIRIKHLHQFENKNRRESRNFQTDIREQQRKRKMGVINSNAGLLRCHQSKNRSQDKNSQNSAIHLENNIKNYFKFLDSICQVVNNALNDHIL